MRRGGTRLRLALALLVVLLAVDLARPPAEQLSARALLVPIHLYQRTLSPRMPALGVHCRFHPTCSHYAAAAIARRGALVGTALAARRLLRCAPWTPAGTVDLPPPPPPPPDSLPEAVATRGSPAP